MRRILTLAMAAALFSATYAQTPATRTLDHAEKAHELTVRMTEQLGLTAEQAEQVEAVNTKFLSAMMPAPGEALDAEAREASVKERDKQLAGILTEEQFKAWNKVNAASNTRSVQPAKLSPQAAPTR